MKINDKHDKIIEQYAIKIAALISNIDVEYRHILLMRTASKLRLNSQGYTAKCIDEAARIYQDN
jgi:phage host-nuclease inhibitor protein Gam